MDPSTSQTLIEEYYMKNNEELHDSMIQEIRQTLTEPLQQLEDLDAEIKDLEDRLTRLKAKRARVQEKITRYDCVLSPIRRVPVDILHNIFYHCLPTHRNPIISPTETPILLTHICRTWRHTAYSSPLLWARIYITFSDEDIISEPEISFGLSKAQVTELLRRRCDVVEEWLSRSGACPLSISICYTSRVWTATSNLYPGGSALTSSLFRILARFSNRWRELELRMPIEAYVELEKMITISDLAMLTSVGGSLFPQLEEGAAIIARAGVVGILRANNLSKVCLLSQPFPLWNIHTNSSGHNWANITDLFCNWEASVTETALLVKACPKLEYLAFTLKSDPDVQDPSVLQGRLSLPNLRALSIIDTTHPDLGVNIYEFIDAPKLKWIDYKVEYFAGEIPADQVPHVGNQVPDQTNLTPPPPIVALIQRSTELKKLTIEAQYFTTTCLRRVLESAQIITHLVLGQEATTLKNNPLRSQFYGYGGPSWYFGDLFPNRKREEVGADEPSSSLLLPHLEVLEMSEGSATNIPDETLLEFITSRMHHTESSSSNDVASLKQVSIMFDRSKFMDITERVNAHAKHVGRDIKLELSYCDELKPGGVNFGSPEYGLDSNGPSWKHRDIEEEMALLPY